MASFCNPKCLVSSIVVELAIIHKEHQLEKSEYSKFFDLYLAATCIITSNIVSFQLNNPYNIIVRGHFSYLGFTVKYFLISLLWSVLKTFL